MTRLLLIRHAESQWNAQGRWQGRGDPPLSPTGQAEAVRAASALGDLDAVVASPLVRAQETAAIIARELQLGSVLTERDLCEIDVGDWTGLTMAEIEARYAAELAAYRSGDLDASAPGGESRRTVLERVVNALERVASEHRGRRVLVVTHGGVIGTLERHLGCHSGVGTRHLCGRWFTFDGELHHDPDRVELVRDAHETAPEDR